MSEEYEKNKSRDEATENLFNFNDGELAKSEKPKDPDLGKDIYDEELSLQNIFLDKQSTANDGQVDASGVVDEGTEVLAADHQADQLLDGDNASLSSPEKTSDPLAASTSAVGAANTDATVQQDDTFRAHRQTIQIEDTPNAIAGARSDREVTGNDAVGERQDSFKSESYTAATDGSAAILIAETNNGASEANAGANENSAPIAGPDITATVSEGDSSIVGRVTSFDADDAATASFSITAGSVAPAGFVLAADGSYRFDPADPAYDHLNVGDAVVLSVPVTVTDNNEASDTAQIQITVTGTNDAPLAGVDIVPAVVEGAGTISGRLTSTDLDDNSTAVFSLTEGVSAPEGFTMDADGSYRFDPADRAYDHLNVGDSQVLEIPVTVTDDQGATASSQIQITVTGTNDAPTAISATGGTVPENVAAGTVVAQLSASDVDDDSESLSYAISGDSSLFEIAGDQVVVKNGAQIDYEADAEHTLNIQVTDANGASYQQDIQIQVSDINETPTAIALSASVVNENVAGGTVVATLSASDPDSDESFSYQLTDESGLFELAGNQVVVKEGADIDYESAASHGISVAVTDLAGNSYSEDFTIQVNDIFEGINPDAGDDILLNSFTPQNATLTAELNFDTGVPSATVGTLAAEAAGQVGNAADFSSAKLSVGGLDLSGEAGAQTTVSMWIQGTPEGSWEMLAAADLYDLALLNGNIGFNTGNGDLFGTDASELSDGEWHHVVGTFTNGDVTQNSIFIDGVEQDMSQIQSSPNNARANIDSDSGTLHFGSWGASNSYLFSGSMDEIKVFNGDLSANEVSELYAIEAGHDHWENSGPGDALEDVALVINPEDLLANDTDADSDTLTIASVEGAEHGSVEINDDGDIVFTPEENYHGAASFGYTVIDGEGGKDSATVNLNVTSVNDLPVIDVVNSVSVNEDGQVNIVYDVSDIDSDSVSLVGSSDDGAVTINDNGTLTFAPAENFSGATSITLTATDTEGDVATQEIGVTVNEVADAPVAGDDTLANSFTPQNATLTAELNFDTGVPSATVGTLAAEAAGQVGNAADFSSAKLSVGGLDLSGEAGAQTTVSMWIQGTPEGSWEMLAAADLYDLALLNGNIGFNTGNGDLFGTDASELSDGEWHHVVGTFTNGDVTQNSIFIDGVEQDMSQIQSSPNNGSANIDSDSGTLHFGSWGHSNGYLFSGSMDEIKVFNGDLSADEVSELYAIEAGHDHWENSGPGDALEDVALVINPEDLLANDTDIDSDALTIASVEAAEHGSVEINDDGDIVFTPEENYHGAASFGYTVSDGDGGTDSATVNLNVTSVNDLPVIDVVNSVSVDEDGQVNIVYDVSDIDSDSVSLVGSSDDGAVTINDNSTLTFAPAENFSGATSITLTATDTDGGVATQEIGVTVNEVADAPVAGADTLANSFAPQNATLTAELNFDDGVPSATVGTLAAEAAGQVGNAADFSSAKLSVGGLELSGAAGDQTTVSMWIQGTPEGSWEMLAAADLYDLALLNGNIGFNTGNGDLFGTDASELADGEWHHVVGTFTNGDVAQNSIFIDGVAQDMAQIQSSPNNGSANIDSDNGTLHFGSWGHSNGYLFSGSMDEIKVFNGDLSADEVSELYAIEAGHDHWDNSGPGDALEDVALVINPEDLLANDTDADSDALTIASVEAAEHGSVEINDAGEIVFTPEENYHGAASFAYTVSDGNGGTDSATVNLNVTSVNDLPVIDVVNSVSVDKDGQVKIYYDVSDIDSDSVSLVGSSDDGAVTINDNSTLTFTPAENFSGDTSIRLTATDADGAVTAKEVGVEVSDVNVGGASIYGSAADDAISGQGGDEKLYGGDGDDYLSGGAGNDSAYGGDGSDIYAMNQAEGNDYFDGGEGQSWTDTIQLTANPEDGDTPWSITVNGQQVEYDLAAGVLELQPDTSGVISLADGSELTFDGIESIQW